MGSMMITTGRPRSCTCGECKKCKWAVYMREWYRRTSLARGAPATGKRDPEVARRSDAKRARTARRQASLRASTERRRVTNPAQATAHSRMKVALENGTLIRRSCFTCGDPKTDGHHYLGYAPEYWLDIIWLCRKHHARAHRRQAIVMPFRPDA